MRAVGVLPPDGVAALELGSIVAAALAAPPAALGCQDTWWAGS